MAVPLKRREDFDSVRAFAEELARVLVEQDPKQRTLERLKSQRRGRVFLDINRNAYAQMVAPAYAVRARPGAPVSVPLEWGELGKRSLRPDGFTIRNIFARLEKGGDPWADFWRRGVSLSQARQQLAVRRYGGTAVGKAAVAAAPAVASSRSARLGR